MEIKKLIRNSKGDVPVMVLVIGVFGVCTLALLSFAYSNYSLNKSFGEINLMEKMNIDVERDSLSYYYMDKNETRLHINLKEMTFTEEVTVFSAEYFGGE